MSAPDPQDPLPENSWLWRRIFVYFVTIFIMVLISRYGDRLSDIAAVAVMRSEAMVSIKAINAMLSLMKWLLSGLFMMITYYMLAPSAEQMVNAVQAARSFRAGIDRGSDRKDC